MKKYVTRFFVYERPMKKGQGIVEYAVILAIVVGLVVIFLGNIKDTLDRYQKSAVNTMAGG